MYISILFVVILGTTSAIEHTLFTDENGTRMLYEQFKRKYNKVTPNEADDMRFAIFQRNLKRIDEQQKSEQGTAQYGITQFSDLTAEEFRATVGGSYQKNGAEKDTIMQAPGKMLTYPVSCDWRLKGAIGPVKNQGECGSGWAFSAIENIEAQWFLSTGKKLDLSPQQLIDCDQLNVGCILGNPMVAFQQIKQMGGLMLNSDYPYKASQGQCMMNKTKFKAHITDYNRVTSDEYAQAEILFTKGPLSAMLNSKSLQFYIDGIMNPTTELCPHNKLDHSVLIVGYGIMKTWTITPYWLVKNSWGVNWGEEGYFRIFRNYGVCGINRAVSMAIVG